MTKPQSLAAYDSRRQIRRHIRRQQDESGVVSASASAVCHTGCQHRSLSHLSDIYLRTQDDLATKKQLRQAGSNVVSLRHPPNISPSRWYDYDSTWEGQSTPEAAWTLLLHPRGCNFGSRLPSIGSSHLLVHTSPKDCPDESCPLAGEPLL